MQNLKITAAIIEDVALKEYDRRIESQPENKPMDVYRRIVNATSSRKDGSINIRVTNEELDELSIEARYSGDSLEASGCWRAWAALARQIRKVRA